MSKINCPICNAGDNEPADMWIICERHRQDIDDDYVFLLESIPEKSNMVTIGNFLVGKGQYSTIEGVHRTGNVIRINKFVLMKLTRNNPADIQLVDPDGFRILSGLLKEAEKI